MVIRNRGFTKLASGVALAILLGVAWLQSTVVAGSSEPAEHTVDIINFKFSPAVLEVEQGDTVTWVNRDIVPHTATGTDGLLDTGEIQAGESRSLVILSDSSLRYICTYHPSMKGEIKL